MSCISKKNIIPTFSVALAVNLLLFAVKLYIGLSSNSISIYSDGINNLFDGLSCGAAAVCFYFLNKSTERFFRTSAGRTEQLLSLALSVMIFVVGLVFFYNSAERLMYPTPVWFTVNYFWTLAVTAAVKLVMFFILKKKAMLLSSEVVKVMSLDSLTDFFITTVTVITLFASQKGGYSYDACAGIAISIFILVTAFKNLKKDITQLVGLPEKEKRTKFEQIVDISGIGEDYEIEFSLAIEEKAYLKTKAEISEEGLESLKKKVYSETGIKLYLIK